MGFLPYPMPGITPESNVAGAVSGIAFAWAYFSDLQKLWEQDAYLGQRGFYTAV